MKKIVLLLMLLTNFAFGQDTIFPMELFNYEVKMERNDVIILWTTNSEINTDYFIITKSYNGADFYQVGMIMGNGDSKLPKPYTFIDENFIDYDLFQNVVFYMLVHVDKKGNQTLLEPKYIIFRKNTNKVVTKVINYLGQEVTERYKGLKTYFYDDNTTERTF